jgi:hypothetical protein
MFFSSNPFITIIKDHNSHERSVVFLPNFYTFFSSDRCTTELIVRAKYKKLDKESSLHQYNRSFIYRGQENKVHDNRRRVKSFINLLIEYTKNKEI